MSTLHQQEIQQLLDSDDPDSLFIDPLLEPSQVGDLSVDLRLGYDFLVSIVTRQPYISVAANGANNTRAIASYFQETRRDIGSGFVLYPNQVVLATSLEFISLPRNIYGDVLSRSSVTRLGIHINTMVQPGFRGCIPLELFNHGNNAVELVVGARICQLRLSKIGADGNYAARPRKYYGDVRPSVSRADKDGELDRLKALVSPGMQ